MKFLCSSLGDLAAFQLGQIKKISCSPASDIELLTFQIVNAFIYDCEKMS